jgi:hypothetical protein
MVTGDRKMNLIFWKKYQLSRILICIAIASLTGCSSINTMLNNFNSDPNSVYAGQPNVPEDAPSSDDTPFAIQQYLDQIKVAQNNQSDEQRTPGKSEVKQ